MQKAKQPSQKKKIVAKPIREVRFKKSRQTSKKSREKSKKARELMQGYQTMSAPSFDTSQHHGSQNQTGTNSPVKHQSLMNDIQHGLEGQTMLAYPHGNSIFRTHTSLGSSEMSLLQLIEAPIPQLPQRSMAADILQQMEEFQSKNSSSLQKHMKMSQILNKRSREMKKAMKPPLHFQTMTLDPAYAQLEQENKILKQRLIEMGNDKIRITQKSMSPQRRLSISRKNSNTSIEPDEVAKEVGRNSRLSRGPDSNLRQSETGGDVDTPNEVQIRSSLPQLSKSATLHILQEEEKCIESPNQLDIQSSKISSAFNEAMSESSPNRIHGALSPEQLVTQNNIEVANSHEAGSRQIQRSIYNSSNNKKQPSSGETPSNQIYEQYESVNMIQRQVHMVKKPLEPPRFDQNTFTPRANTGIVSILETPVNQGNSIIEIAQQSANDFDSKQAIMSGFSNMSKASAYNSKASVQSKTSNVQNQLRILDLGFNHPNMENEVVKAPNSSRQLTIPIVKSKTQKLSHQGRTDNLKQVDEFSLKQQNRSSDSNRSADSSNRYVRGNTFGHIGVQQLSNETKIVHQSTLLIPSRQATIHLDDRQSAKFGGDSIASNSKRGKNQSISITEKEKQELLDKEKPDTFEKCTLQEFLVTMADNFEGSTPKKFVKTSASMDLFSAFTTSFQQHIKEDDLVPYSEKYTISAPSPSADQLSSYFQNFSKYSLRKLTIMRTPSRVTADSPLVTADGLPTKSNYSLEDILCGKRDIELLEVNFSKDARVIMFLRRWDPVHLIQIRGPIKRMRTSLAPVAVLPNKAASCVNPPTTTGLHDMTKIPTRGIQIDLLNPKLIQQKTQHLKQDDNKLIVGTPQKRRFGISRGSFIIPKIANNVVQPQSSRRSRRSTNSNRKKKLRKNISQQLVKTTKEEEKEKSISTSSDDSDLNETIGESSETSFEQSSNRSSNASTMPNHAPQVEGIYFIIDQKKLQEIEESILSIHGSKTSKPTEYLVNRVKAQRLQNSMVETHFNGLNDYIDYLCVHRVHLVSIKQAKYKQIEALKSNRFDMMTASSSPKQVNVTNLLSDMIKKKGQNNKFMEAFKFLSGLNLQHQTIWKPLSSPHNNIKKNSRQTVEKRDSLTQFFIRSHKSERSLQLQFVSQNKISEAAKLHAILKKEPKLIFIYKLSIFDQSKLILSNCQLGVMYSLSIRLKRLTPSIRKIFLDMQNNQFDKITKALTVQRKIKGTGASKVKTMDCEIATHLPNIDSRVFSMQFMSQQPHYRKKDQPWFLNPSLKEISKMIYQGEDKAIGNIVRPSYQVALFNQLAELIIQEIQKAKKIMPKSQLLKAELVDEQHSDNSETQKIQFFQNNFPLMTQRAQKLGPSQCQLFFNLLHQFRMFKHMEEFSGYGCHIDSEFEHELTKVEKADDILNQMIYVKYTSRQGEANFILTQQFGFLETTNPEGLFIRILSAQKKFILDFLNKRSELLEQNEREQGVQGIMWSKQNLSCLVPLVNTTKVQNIRLSIMLSEGLETPDIDQSPLKQIQTAHLHDALPTFASSSHKLLDSAKRLSSNVVSTDKVTSIMSLEEREQDDFSDSDKESVSNCEQEKSVSSPDTSSPNDSPLFKRTNTPIFKNINAHSFNRTRSEKDLDSIPETASYHEASVDQSNSSSEEAGLQVDRKHSEQPFTLGLNQVFSPAPRSKTNHFSFSMNNQIINPLVQEVKKNLILKINSKKLQHYFIQAPTHQDIMDVDSDCEIDKRHHQFRQGVLNLALKRSFDHDMQQRECKIVDALICDIIKEWKRDLEDQVVFDSRLRFKKDYTQPKQKRAISAEEQEALDDAVFWPVEVEIERWSILSPREKPEQFQILTKDYALRNFVILKSLIKMDLTMPQYKSPFKQSIIFEMVQKCDFCHAVFSNRSNIFRSQLDNHSCLKNVANMNKCLHILETSGFDLDNHLETVEEADGSISLMTQGQLKEIRTKNSIKTMKNSLTFKILTLKQYMDKLADAKKIKEEETRQENLRMLKMGLEIRKREILGTIMNDKKVKFETKEYQPSHSDQQITKIKSLFKGEVFEKSSFLYGKKRLRALSNSLIKKMKSMNDVYQFEEQELKAATTATRMAHRAMFKGNFQKAIKMNQTSIIQEFAQNNIQLINVQDKNGYTLLAHAVCLGRMEIVEILLRYGADPNIPIYGSLSTPLHIAVVKDLKKIQDLLIEGGADETKLDATKRTPWQGVKANKPDKN